MCPSIINFDSVDFSERRPEEVISFFDAQCTVRPNKKETRFISEISSLPRKIKTNCILYYQEHFLFFHLIPNT